MLQVRAARESGLPVMLGVSSRMENPDSLLMWGTGDCAVPLEVNSGGALRAIGSTERGYTSY